MAPNAAPPNDAPPSAPLVAADLKFLLSANLGAITTLGYVVLIGIGMLHEVILFRLFGVNVLEWMGPTDFLLVPMRDPLVLLVALAPIPAAWLYWRFMQRAERAIAHVRKNERTPTAWELRLKPWIKPMWAVMLVTWALAAALWYALYKAKDIRAGNGKPIHVEWVDAARADSTAMILLGANASYMVLYNAKRDSTRIVPSSQVLRVNVARRNK